MDAAQLAYEDIMIGWGGCESHSLNGRFGDMEPILVAVARWKAAAEESDDSRECSHGRLVVPEMSWWTNQLCLGSEYFKLVASYRRSIKRFGLETAYRAFRSNYPRVPR